MPVQKFRTLEEASIALWRSPDDPALPGAIRSWWAYCFRVHREIGPRGVQKFGTIEEANAEQETWRRVTMPLGEVGERKP